MTEKQVHEMLRRWQKRLGMENWRIAVVFKERVEVGDELAFAKMCRSTYFDRGTLEVSSSMLDVSNLPECIERDMLRAGVFTAEEYAEETIVHELLHLLVRDMMEASDLARNFIPGQTVTIWDGAWKRAEEDFVEKLSVALCKNWSS